MGTPEILLVEDDHIHIELILTALQEMGLSNSVHIALDGVEALDFLAPEGKGPNGHAGRPPRLIILDLKLPRMDGLSLIKKIRSEEKIGHIPIVILTSSREPRDIAESYRLGATSYIVKPVDFDQFIEAVKAIGSYWLKFNESSLHPVMPWYS